MTITINKYKTRIFKWDVKSPKGILQIVHGSVEHAGRYENMAKWLNKQGIAVWAMDLRGHGTEAKKNDTLGYFGKDGKTQMIEDVNKLGLKMKKEYPGVKYTLLGHSMGSFLVRMVARKYSSNIDNLIIVGTNHQSKLISSMNSFVTSTSNTLLPSKGKGKLLYKASYALFDKKFKGEESGAWLSLNKANRKAYADDELNQFMFSRNAFSTMASWVNTINSNKSIKVLDKNMNVLFLAGENDPVGNMGKEPMKAHNKFLKYGINSKIKLFKDLRHEIHNERNKVDVYKEISKFILKAD